MAKFEIEQTEGMRWVKVTLADDSIRAEKGVLNHMVGDIVMDTPLPSFRNTVMSMISDESLFRPRYSGTGELHLESSLGGFFIMNIKEEETWILSNGTYWASEDEIRLSLHREQMMTAIRAGEGLFWYETALRGKGKVVLSSHGPVEELTLNNGRLVVDGNYVLARTKGISFKLKRPTKSYFSYLLSGESYARVYEGTGRILFCATPYWRYRLKSGEFKDPVMAS